MLTHDVSVERTTECATAVIRANTTWTELPTLWRVLLDPVWAFLRATPGLRTDGHNVMLYRHNVPDVELAVEVGVQDRAVRTSGPRRPIDPARDRGRDDARAHDGGHQRSARGGACGSMHLAPRTLGSDRALVIQIGGDAVPDSKRIGTEGQNDILFRRLVESVQEYAIFLLDPDGHVMTWNPGAERIKGYEAAEIIGQHFGRFYPAGTSKEKLDGELRYAVEHGHFEEENWRIRKDGTAFWANVVITPLYQDQQLVGYIKVTRDLTERLRHEQERAELAANEARARAEVAARDSFLSIAAHELKTPLTSAKAAVQLLERSFRLRTDLDATQARSLHLVVEQIEKLARLVSRLLETVQIQGQRFALFKERTDVAELVRSAVSRLEGPAEQVIALTAPMSLMADVDPLRVEQVLTNLVGNAMKFSPKGEPISVVLEEHPSELRLIVSDRGPGVPEGLRDHLFERFFQANPDRSGMGLGLFITKEIVDRHGGSISVDFPRGGGSRFTVSLPT
ncbi:MAG TPA: PAS domain-containing sensor histidine kinase [Candidatus Saccharimonadales bacterium]|nr:PAS domain-containing sensor histidine kinase [Candidatus Saccharimonadales bacterium]